MALKLNLKNWSLGILTRKTFQAWLATAATTAIAALLFKWFGVQLDPEAVDVLKEHVTEIVLALVGLVTVANGWVDTKHLSDVNKGKV